jgi:hypothetical protein
MITRSANWLDKVAGKRDFLLGIAPRSCERAFVAGFNLAAGK